MSLNEDRALQGMIQDVVLYSFEIIFYALSKHLGQFYKNQGIRSYGT